MTDTEQGPQADATDGTGAGIEAWYAWMIRTHELAENTATGLRNGVRNVLQISPEWEDVDLTRLDTNSQIERFRIAKRGKLSDTSVDEYARRFRVSVESYRKWLDGDKNWKPVKTRANGSSAKKPAKKATTVGDIDVDVAQTRETTAAAAAASADVPPVEATPSGVRMLRYNIPLHSGEVAVVQLPFNLSPADARRVGRVVASLAMDPDDVNSNDGADF